jgi:predicted HAD superfamily Cof-like phosphohydrolase
MIQNMVDSLKEFHDTFHCVTNKRPLILNKDVSLLRAKLVAQEAAELIEALSDGDLVAQFDAIIDLMYVTIGTAVSNGTADFLERGFSEVHQNNMSKLIDGKVLKDSSGKILKPEGYKPVDLTWILEQ